MWKELLNKINKRLGLEKAHKQVNEGADYLIFNNRIANLDEIDPRLKGLTPNRNLIVKNIQIADQIEDQIEETINIGNIYSYLPMKKEIKIKLTDADKLYLTTNFKAILAKHLTYHPNYERWYWKDPTETITSGTLESIAQENKDFENAAKTYET